MKCPFRTITAHNAWDFDVPKDIVEFGECYKEECPYCLKVKSVNEDNYYICRKVEKEVG